MTNHNINLVSFLSEGPPNDNGLNIIGNFDLLLKSSFPYFNQITIYTPKILRDLGYAKYVMEYKNTGLVTKNNGLSNFKILKLTTFVSFLLGLFIIVIFGK